MDWDFYSFSIWVSINFGSLFGLGISLARVLQFGGSYWVPPIVAGPHVLHGVSDNGVARKKPPKTLNPKKSTEDSPHYFPHLNFR